MSRMGCPRVFCCILQWDCVDWTVQMHDRPNALCFTQVATALSSFNFGVEAFQFLACVVDFELPVDATNLRQPQFLSLTTHYIEDPSYVRILSSFDGV